MYISICTWQIITFRETVFGTPAFVSLRHHQSKYYVLRNQHLIVLCYPNRLSYVPSRNSQLIETDIYYTKQISPGNFSNISWEATPLHGKPNVTFPQRQFQISAKC